MNYYRVEKIVFLEYIFSIFFFGYLPSEKEKREKNNYYKMRSSQNETQSKPKGVYSIDQILGTHNRQNNNAMGEQIIIKLIQHSLECVVKMKQNTNKRNGN